MAKHTEEPKTEATIAVTVSDMQALVRDAVRAQLADIMTAKTPDEQIRDALDRQRGIGRPTAQEFLVPCKSPVTGSTFVARLIASKSLGMRVVELLDYQRPDGWDRKVADGGIVEDGDQMPLKEIDGKPGKRYVKWLYESFLMRDSNDIGGKPLPPHYRIDFTPPVATEGSVTLSAEQIAQLGLTPEQLRAAVEPKAAE